MGEPMCANLARKCGKPVFATDKRPERTARVASEGVKGCATLADIACSTDAVFLSLPTGGDVEEVCLGEGGLVQNGSRTHTIVDMSTSPVSLTRDLARRLAERGIAFADAPVARTRQAAHDGTLSIMVGADAALFAAIRPYLACMGAEITHCGDIGCGQVVKTLNNMALFITVNALAEALAIGRAAGVDGVLLFQTMAKGSSDSFALRNHGLNFMLADNFPEDTFPTDYAVKDIRLALELAREAGVDARAAQQTCALLEATSRAGYGKSYYPAMLKLVEPN
jgi:3-hydroxyisobutyrate dehydrogenase-like beta-hydroxyacid dehydrogenase